MLSKIRRYFGASAPKLTVKTQMPWPWRVFTLATAALLVAGLVWWGFDAGRLLAGFNRSEAEELRSKLEGELTLLQQEVIHLRASNAKLESELKVSLGTQDTLSKQALALQAENSQLKEELVFLQKLFAGSNKEGSLSIQRLQVDRETDDRYRYRLLIVQGGTKGQLFDGHVQLQVSLLHEGRKLMLSLPDDQPHTAVALKAHFTYYQRVEGVFTVPSGSLVKSVQARLLENGSSVAKTTQTINLS